MKIFVDDRHELHAPGMYVADGVVRACPERGERVGAILGAVGGLEGVEICAATVDPWGAIRGVHDGAYLEYLRTIHGVWAAEFGAGDVIPDTFPMRRSSGRIPKKPSAQAGYFCFDMAAPITGGTFEAAVGSAGCAVGAADVVLRGERGAYALCRPPGHHAGRDYCGGFCYLNNVAVAAEHLVMGGMKRVAILDVDYHHGNGTQDIFWERGEVLFVSIHAEPDTQYPYFWGHAEERGAGAGEGATVNLPLARGVEEAGWFAALEKGLEVVRAFGAEVLLVSLGVDTHVADGVGDFRLTEKSFRRMGERLRALGLRTCFVQEGGYNLAVCGESVAAVLAGFQG